MRLTDRQQERLEALEQGGKLTAAAVVEDARDPSSPLHVLFPWDDERAAYEWRLEVARRVIRQVEYHVTQRNITIVAPRYVPDPEQPGARPGYARIEDVRDDAVRTSMVVIAELRRALGVLQRAERIARALNIGSASRLSAMVADLTDYCGVLEHGQESDAGEDVARTG